MTTRELKTAIYAEMAQIKQHQRAIVKLKQDFIQSLPFKVGDYVVIFGRNFGWLTRIHVVDDAIDGNVLIRLMFNPRKEDGTRSLREQKLSVLWSRHDGQVQVIDADAYDKRHLLHPEYDHITRERCKQCRYCNRDVIKSCCSYFGRYIDEFDYACTNFEERK
jgi:hypothetical protein